MTMRPQAVVFDIGNVLIGWDPVAFYDRTIGADRRRALFAAVDLHAMNLRLDRGEPFADTVRATAADHPAWRAEILMWHDRWIDFTAPDFPRSVRLQRALRDAGIPVFALSNFGAEPYALAAERYPFLRAFDRVFLSGPLGVIKPDPAIYHALERDCATDPAALLFTDDRPENIAAAHVRGWRTHLFDGSDGLAARLVAEGLLTEEDAQ